MPGRHHGSTNKNQNQYDPNRNQSSSDNKSAKNANIPSSENRGSSTQQGAGGSSMQGQNRGVGSSSTHQKSQVWENRTMDELCALAKQKGIKDCSNMSKKELIRALKH